MTLIADSGSTKTDWALLAPDGVRHYHTQGINPFHQDRPTILHILQGELLPQLGGALPDSVFFYGAGCNAQAAPLMRECLSQCFPTARVEAESDLLGAARALCGHEPGIACILGTGSNSCLYDGHRITDNTPPLGYILGDEGSGATLGKRFLNIIYKDKTWADLRADFEQTMGLTYAEVIDRVYRQPMANRFLASLTRYIAQRMPADARLAKIVEQNFEDFFERNVRQYQGERREVGCVGSVAYYFQQPLRAAAARCHYQIGKILERPIDGLTDFHR